MRRWSWRSIWQRERLRRNDSTGAPFSAGRSVLDDKTGWQADAWALKILGMRRLGVRESMRYRDWESPSLVAPKGLPLGSGTIPVRAHLQTDFLGGRNAPV